MTTSSAYFCTIRPAPGFIVPEGYTDLENYLTRSTKSAVIAVEKEGHSKHIHFCFITDVPRRKDNVLASIKTIVQKNYLNAQIKLKIALDEGAYFYTIKDGNIVFRFHEETVLGYIDDDYERSLLVIEENTVYKNTRIKFSYSNKLTWQKFFNECHQKDRHVSLPQWQAIVWSRDGNLASSEFLWDLYYKQYYNDATGYTKKVQTEFSDILETNKGKKRKLSAQEDCYSEEEFEWSGSDSEFESSEDYIDSD